MRKCNRNVQQYVPWLSRPYSSTETGALQTTFVLESGVCKTNMRKLAVNLSFNMRLRWLRLQQQKSATLQ